MKKRVGLFVALYVVYGVVVSIYLLHFKAGVVPSSYLGTRADPHTFMTQTEITKSHQVSTIYYFDYLLVTPFSLFLPLILMGASVRFRNFAKRLSELFVVQLCVYLLFFIFLFNAIFFPLQVFLFWMNHYFGLSSQSFVSWLGDYAKSFLITYGTNVIVVWTVFFLIRKSRTRWWLYTWILSIPAIVFVTFITPVVLDPIYNQFQPMPNGPKKQEIIALAQKAGIRHPQIFVVNKSKQTNQMNAYVNGIGSSARIVIWDTTLKNMSNQELRFVLAHEMGHYVHKDIQHAVVGGIVGTFLFCLLSYYLYGVFYKKLESRYQLQNQHDLAAFPILLFVYSLLMLCSSPISNAISRNAEHHADQFGIQLTQNSKAAVSAFQKLNQGSLGEVNPPPVIQWMTGNHPTMLQRIVFVEHPFTK